MKKGSLVSYGEYVFEHVEGWASLPGNWEWKGIHRPDHMSLDANENMYIAELGNRQGLFPGAPSSNPMAHPAGVKVMNLDGQWLGGWGMSTQTPGDIIAAHALGLDSKGDLYVGETLDGARLQKFVRV